MVDVVLKILVMLVVKNITLNVVEIYIIVKKK